MQHDLGFSRAGLAWVVNGYVLMAGGLLLLGGRMADIFGRRRLFLIGVGLFALASAACGAAVDPGMLVASRFLQGAGEALAAPASLGLIALLFPDPRERMKALGLWGGIAGLGGTSGTVIGGALVDLASWRWIFLVNVPVALAALLLVPRLVSESRMVRDSRRPEIAGDVTGLRGTRRPRRSGAYSSATRRPTRSWTRTLGQRCVCTASFCPAGIDSTITRTCESSSSTRCELDATAAASRESAQVHCDDASP